ncbi:MAG: hypothetical protein A2289_05115 [Deltaproteobacteria bacterium RIFOXYA12_FULL_58_15]|nr:MAG: hypothetical protein A2289_05115 [Deltaproteobacteria bacterium RIFOXYA12_FULL_58_15]OGR08579.1 MAG: hypothetical protein A2341_25450 [Deltaproteobacteria bacterium RIFOXYB12_FULL_58_9]
MGGLFGGVDIGATKLHAVIATADGKVLARARKKSKGKKGFDVVMQRVAAVLEKACSEANVAIGDLEAVGVGAPSPIRPDGTAVNATNLGWSDAALAASLMKCIPRPVVAENDCNLGTLGEFVYGVGQGSQSLVGLFVGTGLGGGIVLGGEMVRGPHHLAAEVGHMIIEAKGRKCGCGHIGCLEAYASKTGMGNRLRTEIEKNGRFSLLQEEEGLDLRNVRSGILARVYAAGDEVVREAVGEVAWYLGLGVANLITLLGPEVIVLGGGVLEALGEEMLESIRKSAKAATFPEVAFGDVKLVLSELGDDAVALGAIAYARSQLS